MRSVLRGNISRSILGLGGVLLLIGAWKAGSLPEAGEEIMADVANGGPSDRDLDLQTQNYYEVLMDVDRSNWLRGGLAQFMSRLLKGESQTAEGGNWMRLAESELVTLNADAFLPWELKSNQDQIYMGVQVRTNQWGMRDSDIEKSKPPGTFRIAIVGASNDMGYGVEVDKIYPELLEQRLNAELAGGAYDRYEILNFSVGGYQLIDRLYMVDQKVREFDCDLILVAATMYDLRFAIYERLTLRLEQNRDLHFDILKNFVADAGIEPGDSVMRMQQKLKPRRYALARVVFEEFKRLSERDETPLAILNFRLRVDPIHDEMNRQTEIAREAGLVTIDIFDAYEGQSDSSMYLTPLDSHPTVKAHQLLADEIYADLLANEWIRGLLHEPANESGGAADGD